MSIYLLSAFVKLEIGDWS